MLKSLQIYTILHNSWEILKCFSTLIFTKSKTKTNINQHSKCNNTTNITFYKKGYLLISNCNNITNIKYQYES